MHRTTKVVPVNKYKNSNGRRPISRKAFSGIIWDFFGGVQSHNFRQAPDKPTNVTAPATPQRRKAKIQKMNRNQNR